MSITADVALPSRAPLFDAIGWEAPDALLAIIGKHAQDPRPHKIDLGVGVFRDELGNTPVLSAVKAAERILVDGETSKSYLGAEGDIQFIDRLTPVVLGSQAKDWNLVRGVQTPGGTGALRLALDLIACVNRNARVWVGSPTWANHVPIIDASGLAVRLHPYFNRSSGLITFDAMMETLAGMAPGDVLLLHGCGHNPTGADLSLEQWATVANLLEVRGAIPLVDLAYHGLGDGLNADAAGTRHLLEHIPEAIVAYSCDKNFGLYRERVGALWIKAESCAAADRAFARVLSLARANWSMPPAHGAAVVRTILDDEALNCLWIAELDAMRLRINRLRNALADCHPRLVPLRDQRGLFATLPIDPAVVDLLREEQGIYMTGSARINIAGLRQDDVPRFSAAITPHLRSPNPRSPQA